MHVLFRNARQTVFINELTIVLRVAKCIVSYCCSTINKITWFFIIKLLQECRHVVLYQIGYTCWLENII